jgi:hypothetical protein
MQKQNKTQTNKKQRNMAEVTLTANEASRCKQPASPKETTQNNFKRAEGNYYQSFTSFRAINHTRQLLWSISPIVEKVTMGTKAIFEFSAMRKRIT